MTFLSGFAKRKAIKYGSQRPSSSLTAFPKLFVVSNDADIGAELTSRKLAVTLSDGTTQVPYGSHSFLSSGGLASFTVRAKFDLNSAANQGDVLGYLYYDHTATDQANRSGVVSGNSIVGFWPLEEDPSGSAPQILDWTGSYNGSSAGVPMSSGELVSAQVAKGLSINSANAEKIATGVVSQLSGVQQFTISAIIRQDAVHTDSVVGNNTGGQAVELFLSHDNGGLFLIVGSWTVIVPANFEGTGFHHYSFVFDGSQAAPNRIKGYVDGVLQSPIFDNGANLTQTPVQTGPFDIGAFGIHLTSIYDEIILSSTARSAAWIAFNYQDQFNNAATFTLGAEESAILPTPASFVESHFVSFGSMGDPTWAAKGHVAFGQEAA
jgi:hypothetical protein